MGSTAAAFIQGPYELRTGNDNSGLTATQVFDSKQNSYARSGTSSGAGRKGNASKRKSTPLTTWGDAEHQTTIRNESPNRSESVRKLTEGVIAVQDEVEVHYDSKSGGASRGSESRGSSEAGYHL